MFDHVPDTTFWPVFALVCLIVSGLVGLLIGRLVRWCDTPSNKYVQHDRVAEWKRRHASSGFKSRMGLR